MPSSNKSRRGRSRRRGGSTPPPNVEMPNAVPPAPQFNQPAAQQNVNMAPVAPQGALGLAFIPLQGAHHYPQVQQHAGRKSRRHKTRRHKSHRRKSHRR